MNDLDAILADNRAAVRDLLAAVEKTGSAFTRPRAPGKWSPSQIVEHGARALEESANVVSGAPTKFPTFPAFLRPLVRSVFYNRVLKNRAFPTARTSRAMNPAEGPPSVAAAQARLNGAMDRFERQCREQASRGDRIISTIFGAISLRDYARFQELHTRHHLKQVPVPATSPSS